MLHNLLECPVCLEPVRVGVKVFSCANDHIVCETCQKVRERGAFSVFLVRCIVKNFLQGINGTCPTCRDKKIKMTRFAGKLAAEMFNIVSALLTLNPENCDYVFPSYY